MQLDAIQQEQEGLYDFPYHYVPQWEPGRVTQHLFWNWGFCYLAGMELVFQLLTEEAFSSLIDIGCGDGRFLREAHRRAPSTEMLGLDYSARAIALARAMNPALSFETRDIVRDRPSRTFEVATIIEVLEHIAPGDLQEFINAVAAVMTTGGRLILTVPHANQPVTSKHYQHFTSALLRELLSSHFDKLRFVPFEKRSRLLHGLWRVIGGQGKHFILTNQGLLNAYFKFYQSHFLYAESESQCLRIACVGIKR